MTLLDAAFIRMVGEMRALLLRARQTRWSDPIGAARLLGDAYAVRDGLDEILRKGRD